MGHIFHPGTPSWAAPCNYLHKVLHRSHLKAAYLALCLQPADVVQDLKVRRGLQLCSARYMFQRRQEQSELRNDGGGSERGRSQSGIQYVPFVTSLRAGFQMCLFQQGFPGRPKEVKDALFSVQGRIADSLQVRPCLEMSEFWVMYFFFPPSGKSMKRAFGPFHTALVGTF